MVLLPVGFIAVAGEVLPTVAALPTGIVRCLHWNQHLQETCSCIYIANSQSLAKRRTLVD
jgi:hypothetical protein